MKPFYLYSTLLSGQCHNDYLTKMSLIESLVLVAAILPWFVQASASLMICTLSFSTAGTFAHTLLVSRFLMPSSLSSANKMTWSASSSDNFSSERASHCVGASPRASIKDGTERRRCE